jgi:hypothetical protein
VRVLVVAVTLLAAGVSFTPVREGANKQNHSCLMRSILPRNEDMYTRPANTTRITGSMWARYFVVSREIGFNRGTHGTRWQRRLLKLQPVAESCPKPGWSGQQRSQVSYLGYSFVATAWDAGCYNQFCIRDAPQTRVPVTCRWRRKVLGQEADVADTNLQLTFPAPPDGRFFC